MLPTRKCHKHLFEGKDSTLGAVSAVMLFATISNDYNGSCIVVENPDILRLSFIFMPQA